MVSLYASTFYDFKSLRNTEYHDLPLLKVNTLGYVNFEIRDGVVMDPLKYFNQGETVPFADVEDFYKNAINEIVQWKESYSGRISY